MSLHEAEWDEDRGGSRHADNRISFPAQGEFHRATRYALPWQECGTHDRDRVVVPSAYIERLFRQAPVPPIYHLVAWQERRDVCSERTPVLCDHQMRLGGSYLV